MSPLRYRLFSGFTANVYGQVINLALQIITVPVLIYCWGLNLYGEWLILCALPVYLSMSEMGFSSVAANKMTMEVANRDKNEALVFYQSTYVLLIIVALAIVLFVAGLSFAPIAEWLNLLLLSDSEISLLLMILAVQVIIQQQNGLLSAGYRCEGNYAFCVWILSTATLLERGTVIFSVALGAFPVVAAVSALCVKILCFIVTAMLLKRKSPWISYAIPRHAFARIREMARPSLAFMGFPVGDAIKNQGMLLVVGAILGPIWVVTLSTMRTLLNVIQQAMGLVKYSVWPEVSRAYGSGDMELVKNLHRIACKFTLWIALVSSICLFVFGDWIVSAWTLGEVVIDNAFFQMMLVASFFNAMWAASSVVPSAINRHEKVALYYVLGSLLSLLSALFLVPSMGLLGVAFTLLIFAVIMTSFVFNLSLLLVRENFSSFAIYVVNPFVRVRLLDEISDDSNHVE
jgi:O-antigen/teichoic acid export membrane protein